MLGKVAKAIATAHIALTLAQPRDDCLVEGRLARVAPKVLGEVNPTVGPGLCGTGEVHDLGIAARGQVRIVGSGRSVGIERRRPMEDVVGDVPRGVEVGDSPLALGVEDVLVVVDEVGALGHLEPLRHRVKLSHGLGVENQHTCLEVVIGILHLEDPTGVAQALAIRQVEVGEIVNITGCSHQVVTKPGIVELCHITLDHEVRVEVKHLVIRRENLLHEEAVVGLHRDVLVVGVQVVALHHAPHVEEGDAGVGVALKVGAHDGLVVSGDIAREHHYIVEALRVGVLEHGVDCHREHGRIGVIGCEDHGDHVWLQHGFSFDENGGKRRRRLGVLEVDALQLLGLPSSALTGAHSVQVPHVEEALGQVPRRTHRFAAVGGHVRLAHKLVQHWEEEVAVGREDLPAHDVHVAEAGALAREKRFEVLRVIREETTHDCHATGKVLGVERRRGGIVLAWGREVPREVPQTLEAGRDHVVALDAGADVGVIQAIAPDGVIVDEVVHDLAVGVLLVDGVGEVEVATIVTEANIGRAGVLPRPVLRRELAVHGILGRDVLALVVMERPVKAVRLVAGANLDGLENLALGNYDVLVRCHEDADVLGGKVCHVLGMFDL